MEGWGTLVAGVAILTAVVVLVLIGVAAVRSRHEMRHTAPVRARWPAASTEAAWLDPCDDAALATAFAWIDQEDRAQRVATMSAHLETLMLRGVPLRYVRPSARSGIARLGFADGTVVLARSLEPAHLGVLARHCQTGSVQACSVQPGDSWVDLRMTWPGGQTSVRVLGRDQAD